jgi:hypothetical protein
MKQITMVNLIVILVLPLQAARTQIKPPQVLLQQGKYQEERVGDL